MSAMTALVKSFAGADRETSLQFDDPRPAGGRGRGPPASARSRGSRNGTESTLSSSLRPKLLERTTPAADPARARRAVTRSTNTVTRKVRSITRTYSRRIARRRTTKRQSTISQPTFIRMPARTAERQSVRRSSRIRAAGRAGATRPEPRPGDRAPPARIAGDGAHGGAGPRAARPAPPARQIAEGPDPRAPGWGCGACGSANPRPAEVSRLSMEPRRAMISAGSTRPPIEPPLQPRRLERRQALGNRAEWSLPP